METKYENLLEDGSGNVIQSFFDNFLKSNADFRNKAGFRMTVIRESIGVCCAWCQDLVGTYDYDSRPSDIYARHKNCNCIVYTKTGRGTYQDAWSRKEYDTEREARIARAEEIVKELEKTTKISAAEKENKIKHIVDYVEKLPDFFVGENGKTLKAEYRHWIGKNMMKEYLERAKSETVVKYIRSDYRPTSFIGDGSTADIRRFEIETGLKCGRNGKDHSVKVEDLKRQINKALLQNISDNDKIFLEKQLKRLIEVS